MENNLSALNDKHIQRIITLLTAEGWEKEKILDFIQHITE